MSIIEQATAPQLRQSLMLADAIVKKGIRFVPMPCFTEEEFEQAADQMLARLEKTAVQLEATNG